LRNGLLGSTMIAGLTVAAASLALATAAQAQSTPSQEPQDDATTVDDVVVTGSRIARQDFVSTSPIVTVGQEDFQATGSVTIDTLINDLPQFVPAINQTSNNPSNGGQANINLRGLGTQRTLVLMNGRRVVPSNSDGTVDINIIPTALIRNVEVISGGASAAYGSDALAGVANFILDDKFSGVQIDAQYGVTDRDDGATESYSLTMGGDIADGRGNVVLSLGRSTRDLIFNLDRDFSRISGASGTSPLGSTVFDAGNQPNQAFLNAYFGGPTVCPTPSNAAAPCIAPGGTFGFNNSGSLFSYTLTRNFESPGGIDYDGFATPGTGSYLYNTGPLNYMQLPLERWNAYVGADYKLNEAAEIYANMLFTEYTSANELAASPAAGNIVVTPGGVVNTGFRVPVTNPFISPALRSFLNARANPNQSFLLNKRFTDVGGRRGTENYEVYQGTVGVRGDLIGLRDWTYDVYAQYGRMSRITVQTGNISRSAVQTLLDAPDGGNSICAGGFDPFGESNLSPACAAYISRTSQNVTTQEQTVVEASLQGSLIDLPAGDLRFAGGIQYREDEFVFQPDASLARVNPVVVRPDGGQTGGSEIAGFNPSSPLSGVTNSTEFFLELLVPVLADLPLIQQLDLNLGYRLSDYNTVGWVDAYKADVDWQVFDFLRIRGGISRSVRAPSVGELFAPNNTSFPSIGTPSATGLSGDPCDNRSSYRNGPNKAAVEALCLAQGIAPGALAAYQTGNNQVPGITGGNPDLIEETSDSFTAGVVITSPFDSPWLSGFSTSIDYYDIEIENVIGTIGASAQLQGCFNAQGQNPTYSQANGFCQLFVRDPLSGAVAQASEINGNLATLKTSGVDAQIDWNFVLEDIGMPDWGRLNFNFVIGWLENRERQDVQGGPFISRTGTIDSVFGNTFPEWKALSSVNWSMGDFGVGARWRHVGEMTQFGTTNVLDAVDYFDLNASWDLTESVSLRATVNNVADEEPRVYSPGVQANTDPSTYDTLGRRYSIGLTAKF
jgi:outer membrane receptor protein involved in Fe transport